MVSGVGSSCEEGCLANSRRSLHDASVYMAARKKLSPAPRKQGSRQVALRLPFPVHFWGRAIFFGCTTPNTHHTSSGRNRATCKVAPEVAPLPGGDARPRSQKRKGSQGRAGPTSTPLNGAQRMRARRRTGPAGRRGPKALCGARTSKPSVHLAGLECPCLPAWVPFHDTRACLSPLIVRQN